MKGFRSLNWWPLRAVPQGVDRLKVGDLVAFNHGVWRYAGDSDRGGGEVFVMFEHHAGYYPPEWVHPTKKVKQHAGVLKSVTHERDLGRWVEYAGCMAYPGNRWPMCSCCREPMPCRAQLQDEAAAAANEKMEGHAAKVPGSCWACSEVITSRQKTVTYPGENLDHPLQPAPRFHIRRQCLPEATRYEERWLQANSKRPRILTWPICDGIAITHHDGTVTCAVCDGVGHRHSTHSNCGLASDGARSSWDGCDAARAAGKIWGCRDVPLHRDVDQAIATAMALA